MGCGASAPKPKYEVNAATPADAQLSKQEVAMAGSLSCSIIKTGDTVITKEHFELGQSDGYDKTIGIAKGWKGEVLKNDHGELAIQFSGIETVVLPRRFFNKIEKVKAASSGLEIPTQTAAKFCGDCGQATDHQGHCQKCNKIMRSPRGPPIVKLAPVMNSHGLQCPAPFLRAYFKQKESLGVVLMEEILSANAPEDLMKMLTDHDSKEAELLTPLLEKSFQYHDTRANGVLDKEEAKVFFSHLVAELNQALPSLMARMTKAIMKIGLAEMMEVLPERDRAREKGKIEREMREFINNLKFQLHEAVTEYKRNKDKHDAAAFGIMDKDGNGTIEYNEFAACMDEKTTKGKAFQAALGFRIEDFKPPRMQADTCPTQ